MDKKILSLLIVFTLVSGCAQTRNWLNNVGKSGGLGGGDSTILGAPEADEYLQELGTLSGSDPAAQAEIYADARAAAQLTPNPSSSLRYALVLATPGHPESNTQEAQSLLREVLSQSELMTSSEVALATIYLRSVEERIVLEAEARRLRASSSRAARTQEAAVQQRLASVESENRQLRRELAEAENKLEAITSIERSIREQELQ